MKRDYNLIVIGAGSGGLVSAYMAANLGAKVLLIEKHRMGGDCLNTGCVPSKALIHSAKVLSDIPKLPDYKLPPSFYQENYLRVKKRIAEVIQKIEPHDSVSRYRSLGVEVIQGEASLTGLHQVTVAGKQYSAKNLILATGASPLVPKLPGLDQVPYQTSDSLWDLEQLPGKLLVLGGGPIGCELAQAFSRLGSQVTLVSLDNRLLPREDESASQLLEKIFTAQGIQLRLGAKAKACGKDDQGFYLESLGPQGTHKSYFDQLLMAVGRKPQSNIPGLKELHIPLGPRGEIIVDAYQRTKFKHIYAVGDVSSAYQFTHAASEQAIKASLNALFRPLFKSPFSAKTLPWVTFTDPEIARVGLNLQEAEQAKVNYDLTHFPLDEFDRALCEDAAQGFVQILTQKGSDQILGVTLMASRAGEMIGEFVLAMNNGLGLNKILSSIHPYPTWSEANRQAAGMRRSKELTAKKKHWLAAFHQFKRS